MIVVHLDTGTFIRRLPVNFSYCVHIVLICETINVIINWKSLNPLIVPLNCLITTLPRVVGQVYMTQL